MSCVRQCITGGVAEHVRVGLEPKVGLGPYAFDHASEPGSAEVSSALRSEHERRLGSCSRFRRRKARS
jgi:hypothetical protein